MRRRGDNVKASTYKKNNRPNISDVYCGGSPLSDVMSLKIRKRLYILQSKKQNVKNEKKIIKSEVIIKQMSRLSQHEKSDKIKWAVTGISFLLVAVILTGICLQIFGAGKQKPSEWFKKQEPSQTVPEDKDGMIVTPEDSAESAMRLTSSPRTLSADEEETIEKSVTITATIYPSDSEDRELEWSLSFDKVTARRFNNENNTWEDIEVMLAEDGNRVMYADTKEILTSSDWTTLRNRLQFLRDTPLEECVSVVPSSDTESAVLNCYKGFSVSITLTVRLKSTPDIFATCKVDYLSRYNGIGFNVEVGDWLTFDEVDLKKGRFIYTFDSNSLSTKRTSGGVSLHTATFLGSYVSENETGNASYLPALTAKISHTAEYAAELNKTSVFTYTSAPLFLDGISTTRKTTTQFYGSSYFPLSLLSSGNYGSATITEQFNAAVEALRNLGDRPFMTLTVNMTYTEAIKSAYGLTDETFEIGFYADLNSLTKLTSDVSFSDDKPIVF